MVTTYRAPNEYAWSAFLSALDIPHAYEALEPDISRAIRYQPDFWLPDSLAWLEIKPINHARTPGEARVAWQLHDATRQPVYLAAGWPRVEGLRLWVFAHPCPGEQEATDRQALLWLALLLNRPLWKMLEASKDVMRRRLEFVRLWKESSDGR